jgi:hypothetical protein
MCEAEAMDASTDQFRNVHRVAWDRRGVEWKVIAQVASQWGVSEIHTCK